jgi:hypothetical protein
MASATRASSRFPGIFLPALLVSLASSVLCAGALYYVLAEQDRMAVAAHNQALDQAAEEKARGIARTFAWFTERLLAENRCARRNRLAASANPAYWMRRWLGKKT